MGRVALIFSVLGALVSEASAQTAPVTYARDIAPVVTARCAGCHRAGGDAPFPLSSYDEVRRRASMIATVTAQRYMPPWKPEPGFGEFSGQRHLSDAEIGLFRRWADAGAPEGRGPRAAADPAGAAGPQPDLVLRLPEYTLRADGPDVFRNFVVSVPLSAMRYVRGLQFTPHNRAVHHANIRVDATPASMRADEADPAPGYEGLVLRSADFPDGHFLGWTPGQVTPALSDDTAWRLDPGSSLVVQLHLRPTGRAERIAPVIGLFFTDRAPVRLPTMIRLGRQNLSIPAGDAHHIVTDSLVLPVDAEIRAIQPHAHYRARTVQAWATLPDGNRRPLIRIDDWDVNWQDRYTFATPFWLPRGTTLSLEYTFDNSAGNPRNPIAPPQHAGWGWRTVDEMADLWLQVMTRSTEDRGRLERTTRAKMLTEDAIGSEQVLTREPAHADLHNDVALIYMSLNQPANALSHFEVVTRLRPESAPSRFNEGVALEAMGEAARAETKYREAILRSPEYSAALNNLGAVLLRADKIAEARVYFERAVKADPRNVEARANLSTIVRLLAAFLPSSFFILY